MEREIVSVGVGDMNMGNRLGRWESGPQWVAWRMMSVGKSEGGQAGLMTMALMIMRIEGRWRVVDVGDGACPYYVRQRVY